MIYYENKTTHLFSILKPFKKQKKQNIKYEQLVSFSFQLFFPLKWNH